MFCCILWILHVIPSSDVSSVLCLWYLHPFFICILFIYVCIVCSMFWNLLFIFMSLSLILVKCDPILWVCFFYFTGLIQMKGEKLETFAEESKELLGFWVKLCNVGGFKFFHVKYWQSSSFKSLIVGSFALIFCAASENEHLKYLCFLHGCHISPLWNMCVSAVQRNLFV